MNEDQMPKALKQEILPAIPPDISPPALLQRAVENNANIEMIVSLSDRAERYYELMRQKEFAAAFVSAKAEMPIMLKNKLVDFATKSEGRKRYRHADLAEIVETVTPILAKHNLAANFRVANTPDTVTVTCRITHANGLWEEPTSMTAHADMSGNKNALQALGSTETYLMRYTLCPALGLAAAEDDDARSAVNDPVLSTEQINELEKLIPSTDVMNLFMDWVRKTSDPLASSVADIKQSFYKQAYDTLAARKRKNEGRDTK